MESCTGAAWSPDHACGILRSDLSFECVKKNVNLSNCTVCDTKIAVHITREAKRNIAVKHKLKHNLAQRMHLCKYHQIYEAARTSFSPNIATYDHDES